VKKPLERNIYRTPIFLKKRFADLGHFRNSDSDVP
jgi:hypothetical protein